MFLSLTYTTAEYAFYFIKGTYRYFYPVKTKEQLEIIELTKKINYLTKEVKLLK